MFESTMQENEQNFVQIDDVREEVYNIYIYILYVYKEFKYQDCLKSKK